MSITRAKDDTTYWRRGWDLKKKVDVWLKTSMADSRLSPPAKFNSNAPDLFTEWRHWINAFKIYVIATELHEKSDEIQQATLLHCLGPDTQRIFETLPGEKKTFKEAELALEKYFAPKRNVVSERYKFRCCAQQRDELIDSYLTALRELAKSCDPFVLNHLGTTSYER